MRTYDARKRYGASGRQFSSVKRQNEGPFGFLEFLFASGGKNVDAPHIVEYLDTLKYPDGSYGFRAKAQTLAARSAPDLHGTCYAICAMKAIGIEPSKGALDYIERLKNDDDDQAITSATNIPDIERLERLKEERGSFRSGPERWDGDLENTYWAVLALHHGGMAIPEESVDYVSSLRNRDGGYCIGRNRDCGGNESSGILRRTRQALTILGAAGEGEGLTPRERKKTADYIMSRLVDGEASGSNIETCYDAVVSLNLLGVELGPSEREMVDGRLNGAKLSSKAETKFKAAMVKKCMGLELSAERDGPGDLPGVLSSPREALYAVWLKKLLLFHETPKKAPVG